METKKKNSLKDVSYYVKSLSDHKSNNKDKEYKKIELLKLKVPLHRKLKEKKNLKTSKKEKPKLVLTKNPHDLNLRIKSILPFIHSTKENKNNSEILSMERFINLISKKNYY